MRIACDTFFLPGRRTREKEPETMAKIYCAPCFEICTGNEPSTDAGLCRCCGKPIVAVALDPLAHAIPMTRELARDVAQHEAGMLRRDGLEME